MIFLKFIGSHYLLFAALALAVWYGGVLFTFYRNEAKQLYEQRFGKPADPLPFLVTEAEAFDPMGKPAEEYGVSCTAAHEVYFAQGPRLVNDEELQRLIPDVLEEIKQVIDTVEMEGGNQGDFMRLFRLITVKYPTLAASRHREPLTEWLRDICPFSLNETELTALWKGADYPITDYL